MKLSIVASAVVVCVLSAGCATEPAAAPVALAAPTVVSDTGPTECRDVNPPGVDGTVNMCGTAAQWANYERRVALIEANVTCREMLTGSTSNVIKTFCYTPEQWERFNRAQAAESMTQYMGRNGNYGGSY